MPRGRPSPVPNADAVQFRPTAARPVRVRSRALAADAHFEPHRHPWAQVAYCASGILQVSAADPGVNTEASTYIVPPSRAVWIPPGLVHAVTAIEQAELHTLYLSPELLGGDAWSVGRVLEVSPLLRELVLALPAAPDPAPPESTEDAERRRGIERLVLIELQRARPLALGVALPQDGRLRRLCEAMLREPGRHAAMEEWAAEAGASPRTLSRLFREQLGTSFAQWRSQLLLAHALTLAARGRPMSHIASELGYASASAFTAMVTRTVGMPPSRFFAEA